MKPGIALKLVKNHLLLLAVVSLFIGLYVQWPILSSYYRYNGDSSAIIYWLNSRTFDKNNIEPNDLMSKTAEYMQPPLLKAIYLTGSFFIDPLVLIKIIPIFTSTICVCLIYLIGRFIGGLRCGLIAGISFNFVAWYYRNKELFGSADAEEFSLVLMLFFIYMLIKEKYFIILLLLPVMGLLYPPLFILSSTAIFIIFIIKFIKGRDSYLKQNTKIFFSLLLVVSAVMGFLYLRHIQFQPEFLGRFLLPSEVKNIEDFRPGGRQHTLEEPDTLLSRALHEATGIGYDGPKKFMFSVLFVLLLFPVSFEVKKKVLSKMPFSFFIFLISGFTLTIIANFVIFALYETSRYILNPLNIFLTLLLSLLLSGFSSHLELRGKQLIGKVCVSAYLLIFTIISIPNLICHREQENLSEMIPLIRIISTLPENSFIAGHPALANMVGMYAKKRIFLTYKIAIMPYWINYHKEMSIRIEDFFKAYYAQDIEAIIRFCKTYNITHIITAAGHFSKDYIQKGNFFYRPYNARIKKILSKNTGFFFNKIPERYLIYKDKFFSILDCNQLVNATRVPG